MELARSWPKFLGYDFVVSVVFWSYGMRRLCFCFFLLSEVRDFRNLVLFLCGYCIRCITWIYSRVIFFMMSINLFRETIHYKGCGAVAPNTAMFCG
ncbi:hypothetical protein NECAME_14895 [Necator americanus]|uniref:Uncharacterized protein n=1 Tax=Necator americanus TaxID=51031 RepID=W2SNG5_NECAM|nr:hypothetical protein NECAME_14895 [Necator americanus]ETN70242.1 hypothetical protein NECAME_14895 [Necator americanus]